MEAINGLALGFSHALTLTNLGWALTGCFLGTAVGVLPGIGPALTIALLLPITFQVSATGAFNASNNAVREGMPALDYLFGVGPQAVYKGLQAWPGQPTLHLKVRALMSTDFKQIDRRGFSFDPELRWRLRQVAGTPASLSFSLQPTWASRSLHAYFYQVNPTEATLNRPSYNARAGYLGTEAALTLSHRPQRDLSWFISARLTSLHGAANTGSPLLRDRSNLAVGAGLVWTPWRSKNTAAD